MKKIHRKTYDYASLTEGERQYDDIDYSETLYIDARYVKAMTPGDVGNKYIEALPRPRNDREVLRAYQKDIFGYNMANDMQLPHEERKYMVSQLRQLRFPLPFHRELEFSLYNALVNSYRDRFQLMDNDLPLPIVVGDKETKIAGKLIGDSASAANAGFALLGCSGCGKSSSLKILLSNYPQMIVHHDKEFGKQPQIVYLVVNCIANSNFAALYTSIGDAIDKALGITNGCYAKMISSKRNLGEKAEKVRELIEIFAVGIIIFDEIQLIDFSSTKENSFESLMTLTNRTKVAIAVVGTEDAYAKMFVHLRTARRIGNVISGNNYCDNRGFFEMLVKKLLTYQWFDTPILATPQLMDAFYENTHGIIDQMIGLYMFMNIDYLSSKKHPMVDAAFIKNTAEKHYRGVRLLLIDYEDPMREMERRNIAEKAEIELQKILACGSQNSFADKISQDENKSGLNKRVQKNNVIKNIQMATDEYSDNSISDCFDKVMNLESNSKASERDITRQVLKKLIKKAQEREHTAKKKKPDHDKMVKYIMT